MLQRLKWITKRGETTAAFDCDDWATSYEIRCARPTAYLSWAVYEERRGRFWKKPKRELTSSYGADHLPRTMKQAQTEGLAALSQELRRHMVALVVLGQKQLLWQAAEGGAVAYVQSDRLKLTWKISVYDAAWRGSYNWSWCVDEYETDNNYQESNDGGARQSNHEFPPGNMRQAKGQAQAAFVGLIQTRIASLAVIVAACDAAGMEMVP